MLVETTTLVLVDLPHAYAGHLPYPAFLSLTTKVMISARRSLCEAVKPKAGKNRFRVPSY